MSLIVANTHREQHVAVLDAQTPVHFGVGVGAGVVGVSPTVAILADLALEAALLSAKDGAERALFDKHIPASSIANHAADILATVAGFYTGKWLAARWRPAP